MEFTDKTLTALRTGVNADKTREMIRKAWCTESTHRSENVKPANVARMPFGGVGEHVTFEPDCVWSNELAIVETLTERSTKTRGELEFLCSGFLVTKAAGCSFSPGTGIDTVTDCEIFVESRIVVEWELSRSAKNVVPVNVVSFKEVSRKAECVWVDSCGKTVDSVSLNDGAKAKGDAWEKTLLWWDDTLMSMRFRVSNGSDSGVALSLSPSGVLEFRPNSDISLVW